MRFHSTLVFCVAALGSVGTPGLSDASQILWSSGGAIYRSAYDGSTTQLVVSENSIGAIDVDSDQGWLYWYGRDLSGEASIRRYDLQSDNAAPADYFTQQSMRDVWAPTHFSASDFDYYEGRLYWAAPRRWEFWRGGAGTSIFSTSSAGPTPSGFAVHATSGGEAPPTAVGAGPGGPWYSYQVAHRSPGIGRDATMDQTHVYDETTYDLEVDAATGDLYWIRDGSAIARNGESLITGLSGVRDVALDDLNREIYWATSAGAFRRGMDGGTTTQIFAGSVDHLGVFLVSVPEPTTSTLFTVGLLLGLTQRRRSGPRNSSDHSETAWV